MQIKIAVELIYLEVNNFKELTLEIPLHNYLDINFLLSTIHRSTKSYKGNIDTPTKYS